jgi:hypothetical protein
MSDYVRDPMNDQSMQVSEWITCIDALREEDELLQRGAWHAYLNEDGRSQQHPSHPLKGRYALARWKSSADNAAIVVAQDIPNDALALARLVERALKADGQ